MAYQEQESFVDKLRREAEELRSDTSFSEDLRSEAAKLRGETVGSGVKPSLAAKARQAFSMSYDDVVESEWRKRKSELELDPQYGKGRVDVARNKEGDPIGFDVAVKNVQGFDELSTIEDPLTGKRVKAAMKQRGDILREVQQRGGAISNWQRFKKSWKITDPGAASFLAKEFGGKENVIPVKDKRGNLQNFIVIEDGVPKIADPEGLDLGDILDVAAPVLESVPGAVGSIIGAYFGGQRGSPGAGAAVLGGAGDIAGNLARQAGSEIVGGEDYPGLTGGEELAERGKELGIATIPGLGFEAGAKVGRGIKNLFGPNEWQHRQIAKMYGGGSEEALAKTAYKKGVALEKRTGMEGQLLPGQLTLEPAGLGHEVRLRRSPEGANILNPAISQQLQGAARFLDKTTEAVFGGAVDPRLAGGRVARAYTAYLQKLAKARSIAAGPHFDAAHKLTGGAYVVDATKVVKVLEDIIERNGGDITTGSGDAIVAKMLAMHKKIATNEGKMTIGGLQSNMERIGKSVYGKEKLVDSVFVSKSKDQVLSERVLNSLRDALDDTIKGGGVAGDAAHRLHAGRRAWAEGSALIDQSRHKVMDDAAKAFRQGKQGAYARKLLQGGYEPEELKAALEIFDTVSPATSQELRASLLTQLLEKTKYVPTEGGLERLSPGEVIKQLKKPDVQQKLAAIFANDPKGRMTLDALGDVMELSRRLTAAGTAGGGSLTQPLQAIEKVFNVPVIGPLGRKIRELIIDFSDDEKIARAVIDPEQRDLLLGIFKPKPWMAKRGIANMVVRLHKLRERDNAELESQREQKPEQARPQEPQPEFEVGSMENIQPGTYQFAEEQPK